MEPNDLSCIYSTLKFVCLHAARYNSTPIITFDQYDMRMWNLKKAKIVPLIVGPTEIIKKTLTESFKINSREYHS